MKIEDIRARCRIEDGHWIWTGATSDGHARIWAPDYTLHAGEMRTQTGRRAVWHVKTGKPIAAGWRVFQTCTMPGCIAPHCVEARPVSKQGEIVAASGKLKGRISRIKANRATGRTRSHLTPELIAEIQGSNEKGQQLAARLDLCRTIISKVRRGKALAFEPVGGLFSGLLAANSESARRAA